MTPRLRLGGRAAFHVFGLAGLAAALIVCALVLAWHDVAPWALPVIALAAVATFLALALGVKVATGRESLIYYHHEILVLTVCAGVVALAGLPVAASLDAAVLGIGAFLAFGRIGCLHVGCCHGRPARRGVVYGPEHAATGLAPELVGVPLVPVQAIESAVAAAITLAGVLAVALGAAPGVALVVYVATYGVARFALEEWRGDPGRRRRLGFSEAQWTSLGLTAIAVLSHPEAIVAPALIALGMLLRRSAVDLRLSSGTVDGRRHYTLSGASPERLRALAGDIVRARHPGTEPRFVDGRSGVLHVVVEKPVHRAPDEFRRHAGSYGRGT